MIWKQILIVIVYAAVSLGLYYTIRTYILKKYTIKKKYAIIAMVVVILLPMVPILFNSKIVVPAWITTISMILFTVIFLIYLDIVRIEKEKKNRPVIGKPKAKPNRIKDDKK